MAGSTLGWAVIVSPSFPSKSQAPTVERSSGPSSKGQPTSPVVSSFPAWWTRATLLWLFCLPGTPPKLSRSLPDLVDGGADVAVAVPLGLAARQADAVDHPVAEEPVGRRPARRVRAVAHEQPAQLGRQRPGDLEVGEGLLGGDRGEVALLPVGPLGVVRGDRPGRRRGRRAAGALGGAAVVAAPGQPPEPTGGDPGRPQAQRGHEPPPSVTLIPHATPPSPRARPLARHELPSCPRP